MLIGKINDRHKQKLLVTLHDVKGTTMIDFRVHQTGQDGELVATPAGVSITADQAEQAIELLKEARRKIAGLP
jgi:hypothetical protein